MIPNKIKYDKKVLIVYNPGSGKKTNVRDKITQAFTENKIESELYETTGHLDAFRKCRDFAIDEYSALVISGGDGSIHECVNGILMRPDGKKIPLGLVPNGSANDTCANLEIRSIDQAIHNLINGGDLIKSDVILNKLDYENQEEMKEKFKEDPDKLLDFKRYGVNNGSFAYSANVGANVTVGHKQWL